MKILGTIVWGDIRATAIKPGSFFALIPIALAVNMMVPFVCHAQPQATKPARSGAETTLRGVIEQRLIVKERMSWQLAIKGDAVSYKALHTPDFFTLSGTGVTDRAHSESSALDPNVHFDQCGLSEFSVRFVAENAALITYRVKASGLDHGKAFQLDSYVSSLWMKRDGRWLNAFYQATPAGA